MFEPPWIAKIGPLVQAGKGLLLPSLYQQRGMIEEFIVPCGTCTVRIEPMERKVWLDMSLKFLGYISERYELRWFRRMEKHLFTQDNSTASPHCLFYGLGLYLNGEPAWGCKIFEDKHIELGI